MKHKITCQNCKSRYLGCHSECSDYIEYRKEKNELNKLRLDKKREEDLFNEYKIEETRKIIKRKRQLKK